MPKDIHDLANLMTIGTFFLTILLVYLAFRPPQMATNSAPALSNIPAASKISGRLHGWRWLALVLAILAGLATIYQILYVIPKGSIGPPGPRGIQGSQGPAGPVGPPDPRIDAMNQRLQLDEKKLQLFANLMQDQWCLDDVQKTTKDIKILTIPAEQEVINITPQHRIYAATAGYNLDSKLSYLQNLYNECKPMQSPNILSEPPPELMDEQAPGEPSSTDIDRLHRFRRLHYKSSVAIQAGDQLTEYLTGQIMNLRKEVIDRH